MDAERLDIEKTLAYLTLDEKLRMITGSGMWHTFAIGELPSVRMSDGPNGLRMTDGASTSAVPATCFPTASMLANSWDPAMLYSVGAAIGAEATAMGVNLLLAPGVNIKRHPLGGRNFEYISEDPLLSGELGKAYISGVQSTGVGACVKHFAANNQESWRMYSDSVIDERALRELYLRPFEIALGAEPAAVMCAYNKLNGEYCSQNEYLLKVILRDEFKYNGITVSDWGAVRDRALSLRAGLDLEMPDSGDMFTDGLRAALECGEVTEEMIDDALRRILELTDNIYLEPYGDFDADAHDKLAYNAAAASVVLLKNDNGFLPLTKDMHVAVCGEYAKFAPIQGGGSSHVTALKTVTPLDAYAARSIEISYFTGYSSDAKENERLMREALEGTAGCDAVIVYAGVPAPYEGVDRKSINLPPEQNELISRLTTAGQRVVVVLCAPGPVAMPWINRVRSVVYAGLNGQNGALAAADVIYGRINPSGKLAETFPVDLNDIGGLGDDFGEIRSLYRESIFVGYKYYDKIGRRALFPFGHGLSFSDVKYGEMRVTRVGECDFEVAVELTNNSVRDAYETVQIYVSDRTGRIMCAEKQLAGYTKAFVEGQTSTVVTIHVPRRAFEFFDVERGAFAIADGEYKFIAAASAGDIRGESTVKIDGDYTDVAEYPKVYDTPVRRKITDEDFEVLYGAPFPPIRTAPKKGEFTLDSSIDDIKKTLPGRLAKRAIMRTAKHIGEPNSPEREAFTSTALCCPLSITATMSDGVMTLNAARGLIQMANGKLFKGLKLYLKKH